MVFSPNSRFKRRKSTIRFSAAGRARGPPGWRKGSNNPQVQISRDGGAKDRRSDVSPAQNEKKKKGKRKKGGKKGKPQHPKHRPPGSNVASHRATHHDGAESNACVPARAPSRFRMGVPNCARGALPQGPRKWSDLSVMLLQRRRKRRLVDLEDDDDLAPISACRCYFAALLGGRGFCQLAEYQLGSHTYGRKNRMILSLGHWPQSAEARS